MTNAELNQMEELLEQVIQGKAAGPPRAWCQEQLDTMREWRGHYDVVADSRGAFPDLTMVVRYAMPLHVTAPNMAP